MKAIVKYGQVDGEVELRDVPVPAIGPDDVLLEVRAAGVCGWDIEMWRHKMAHPINVPVIQGHEFAGAVVEVGANVKAYAVGDRVVSETAAVICGVCPQCRTGNYHLCPDRKGFGVAVDGAFTSFVKAPERCLHRIPDGVLCMQAALTEPACVAYNALIVNSDVRPGEPVVIIGPGPIGLFALQMAKACSAGPVVIVGTPKDAVRFDVARRLGADIMIDVANEDAPGIIKEATHGLGAPLVVDAAGNEKALALAIECVARGGQITKIGWGPKPVNLSLDPLLAKCVRLQGVFSHTWRTWEAVLSMIGAGTIRVDPLISMVAPLEEWRTAYAAVEDCRAVKALFKISTEAGEQ